jgi:hypothetical protein
VRSTSPSTAPPGNDRSLKPLDLDYLDLSLLLDVTPSDEELARIDALDTGVRNGPDRDVARPERFAMVIPEA